MVFGQSNGLFSFRIIGPSPFGIWWVAGAISKRKDIGMLCGTSPVKFSYIHSVDKKLMVD